MEPVKQAGDHPALGDAAEPRQEPGGRRWPGDPAAALAEGYAASRIRAVKLNEARLESRRIISYDVADQRSKSFDMLRTQVLQSMDAKSWQVMAVTSPTAGCGKTLTAINLAISIARQPERSVLLADMDLRKPQVARRLGLKCDAGLLSVLEGQATLTEALLRAQVGRHEMLVLPAESAVTDSSERLASRAMRMLMQEIRADFRSRTVILDLPPMLLSDDVIAVLPQVDCVLLVTAVAQTTVAEVEECNRYLQSTNVVRVVVNKVPEWNSKYY
jgi:protein-tyrosine kinase